MSPSSNVTPIQIETEGASFLMAAHTPELAVVVFDILRKLGQQAKPAVWALIPRDKRAELWHLAAMG
ncbi:MAG: hypothetical protein AB1589_40030 [Cyanobacteriota bacterium]